MADLLTPTNRDAIARVLQIVRGDARVNGGAQIFEVGDPMQAQVRQWRVYATGNMPCICVGWKAGQYVEVLLCHGGWPMAAGPASRLGSIELGEKTGLRLSPTPST